MYSCTGNNLLGMGYGIAGVIIYTFMLKCIKVLAVKNSCGKIDWHKDFWGTHNQFFYFVIILILLFAYFMGKINSEITDFTYFDHETPYVSS